MSDALALVLLAASIGLVDSLNPSTVLPALFFATGDHPARGTLAFACGIFAVNFLGGVALLAGPAEALRMVLPHVGTRAQHFAEFAVAAALLAAAVVVWCARSAMRRRSARASTVSGHAPLLLGATVALLEFPTAIPYFGVIATLTAARADAPVEAVVLCAFNLAFLAPVIGIGVIARVSSSPVVVFRSRMRAAVLEHAGALIAAMLATAAMVLLVVGSLGLAR